MILICKNFIQFNPKIQLKKGTKAKKVDMDKLVPFTRKITGYIEADFTGGSKFINGDTLLARITPCLENGKTAYVNVLEDKEVGFGSTEFIVLRAIEGISIPLFIYYLAVSPDFREIAIASMSGTSGRQRVDVKALEQLEINLPPLEEQKRIAEILGAFDDKIELLQKQNKTLEDMAKAIFKSWFVDFDVVKAKQRGDSKADIMREYHLTEELYDLFPSSFEDSSLGPIPTGWEVKSAGELLEFSIGGGWGNEELTEDFCVEAPVIRGTDIPALRSFGAYKSVPVRYHKGSNHTSRKLKSGDIVLEVAGGSKGQPVGRALFISDYIVKYLPEVICASFCKLLRLNKNLLLPELFYIYLDFMYQTGEIEQYQVQSTGISNFQFKQFCENKHFVVPPQELQTKLSLGIFIDKMSNNKKQIQTLTELRDSLLPRLISGKIRV